MTRVLSWGPNPWISLSWPNHRLGTGRQVSTRGIYKATRQPPHLVTLRNLQALEIQSTGIGPERISSLDHHLTDLVNGLRLTWGELNIWIASDGPVPSPEELRNSGPLNLFECPTVSHCNASDIVLSKDTNGQWHICLQNFRWFSSLRNSRTSELMQIFIFHENYRYDPEIQNFDDLRGGKQTCPTPNTVLIPSQGLGPNKKSTPVQ